MKRAPPTFALAKVVVVVAMCACARVCTPPSLVHGQWQSGLTGTVRGSPRGYLRGGGGFVRTPQCYEVQDGSTRQCETVQTGSGSYEVSFFVWMAGQQLRSRYHSLFEHQAYRLPFSFLLTIPIRETHPSINYLDNDAGDAPARPGGNASAIHRGGRHVKCWRRRCFARGLVQALPRTASLCSRVCAVVRSISTAQNHPRDGRGGGNDGGHGAGGG